MLHPKLQRIGCALVLAVMASPPILHVKFGLPAATLATGSGSVKSRRRHARGGPLVRSGLLDLGQVRLKTLPLDQLDTAMDAAAATRGLDCTVMQTA
jgi:hypothetical protein